MMANLLDFFSAFNAADLWQSLLGTHSITELSATLTTSYVLIIAAEMGDKSQLVCMTLASRHKATPVVLGAIAAFAVLNTLAVVFGVAIANWLPEYVVAGTVAVLFMVFGIHALRVQAADDDEEVQEKTNHSVFFTTFLLITVAEFGDKTQLAVVALSSSTAPIAVWLGSTAALASSSALGVLAGQTILKKLPLVLLHKISGSIFLVLAAIAAYRAYISYTL
jgi:putative Ca2+/H+ antiporter (TMEM165/GDT1 family)